MDIILVHACLTAFQMVDARVMTKTDVYAMLPPSDGVTQWSNDHRGGNTVQIVVVIEKLDHIHFLWHSLFDMNDLRSFDVDRIHVATVMEAVFHTALQKAIDYGDRECCLTGETCLIASPCSRLYSQRPTRWSYLQRRLEGTFNRPRPQKKTTRRRLGSLIYS